MRHLGIDYGSRRVGLALSDDAGVMGFPHAVIPNDGNLLSVITDLIEKERVEKVVMGESLDFSGNDNPIAKEARLFAEQLPVPVVFEPEMLTTQEARRDPEGLRTHGIVDSQAAALILTSYLGRPHDID